MRDSNTIDKTTSTSNLNMWLAYMANTSSDPDDNVYLDLKARADALREDGVSESDVCEELALHMECGVFG